MIIIFSMQIDKASGRREIIQCGMGAARDFLRLIEHEAYPYLILYMEKVEKVEPADIVEGILVKMEVEDQ